MNLKSYLNKNKKIIDRALNQWLPPANRSFIAKAMRYSVFAGGKRFRPILMLAVCEALTKNKKRILPAACAVELLHTFTLIHDDLPCMDNDDFRRGKLASHKKFGEAIAILAGDALQAIAFEIMLKKTRGISPNQRLKAATVLLKAIGPTGVVSGQIADIKAEDQKTSLKKIATIHKLKTSALIRAAVKISAIIAGAPLQTIKKLDNFAKHLGLSFQIADDLLDCTSSFAKMGKNPGSDKKKNKATYVSLLGKSKTQQLLLNEHRRALAEIKFLGSQGQTLTKLANFVAFREK